MNTRDTAILITNPEQLEKLTYNIYFKYKCKICEKKCIARFRRYKIDKLKRLLCPDCAVEQSFEDNHNGMTIAEYISSGECQNKIRQTKLERYGDPNYNNREKMEQTMIDKYGMTASEYIASEECQNKIRASYTPEKKKSAAEKLSNILKNKTKEEWNEIIKKRNITINNKTPEEKAKTSKKLHDAWFNKTPEEQRLVVNKITNHFIETIGVKSPLCSGTKTREQGEQTKLKIYGNKNNIEKITETNLKNTGYTCVFANPEIRKTFVYDEKARIANIKKGKEEKYGDPNYNNRPKANKTNIENYGIGQINSFQYLYYDIPFSSLPELTVWIYYKDHNIPILREPIFFEYIWDDGSTHLYYPDFYIFGIWLVEIKGEYFFDENGNMIDPYDRSDSTNQESKHQCGIKNGVIIWREEDYAFAIDYVKRNYGPYYLYSFKYKDPYNYGYENPNGFYPLKHPYLAMPVYYTPLSINNQVTPFSKIDDGYIKLQGQGLTPFDLGYTVTHKNNNSI